MATGSLALHLNIRQKVIVGLTVCFLIIGSSAALSYRYLGNIEKKQHFVEIADDLNSTILEIRRYEKNYLLYNLREDLEKHQRYIQEGLEIMDKIAPEITSLKVSPRLEPLKQELVAYQSIMSRMASLGDQDHAAKAALEKQLRQQGKNLEDLSKELVRFERRRILEIIRTLKTQLVASMAVLIFLAGFLIFIVSRKIIRPLRIIERTTLRIAQGDFQPLPVLDTRDETQRVVEGFNRMVGELEKRQDQLVQAKKLSSLGILTSGVAHQLNNPLNNISTSCQILLEEMDKCDPEFSHKMLENIENEVIRARDIVRGLLEFSRVKEFALKPKYLKEVVERSVRLISSQVPPGIEIVQHIPEELVLRLDAQQMQQVFLNLLMNGVQAIVPPGEIRIAAREDPDRRQVEITVEDTGAGISRKDLGRIFDPFFTTKEVGVGTGLGLSIAYGIIEKHQGTITAESQEGEGTRFIIRLPLYSGPGPERAAP
jgi:two-component system NtrC family sensor kinase